MTGPGFGPQRLLMPSEVAALFRVDVKTVARWAAAGRINAIRTPGGHRRYRYSEVVRFLKTDEGSNGDRHDQDQP